MGLMVYRSGSVPTKLMGEKCSLGLRQVVRPTPGRSLADSASGKSLMLSVSSVMGTINSRLVPKRLRLADSRWILMRRS